MSPYRWTYTVIYVGLAIFCHPSSMDVDGEADLFLLVLAVTSVILALYDLWTARRLRASGLSSAQRLLSATVLLLAVSLYSVRLYQS